MTTRLHPRLALWRAGAFYGILGMFALVVLLPAGLRQAGFDVAKAWGLDSLAAPLCILGGVPGAVLMGRKHL